MDALALALVSAALFGAMTVALRFALARVPDAEAGALLTVIPALAVTLPFVAFQSPDVGAVWPFLLAGLLGPGLSQLLFTLAVRDAGPSRTSVVVGTAPLFSVAIALVLLGEPLHAGLIAGAVLIVAGGFLLVGERDRPAHVKRIGLALALASALVFAARDNLVRHLSIDSNVAPEFAAAATLGAGGAVIGAYLLATRGRLPTRGLITFAPAGVCFGVSYLFLFEAYYRGRVSVVSPLVATESLWGVGLSVLLLRRSELVGARLFVGAGLVVAGGALIGILR
ncbi:MAG: DMT family transporter [Actinobacteria bacterium]|nr:DMT family transporter [Actinomycetota bacterium]